MIDYLFLQKNTDTKIILDLLNEFNDYFIPRISDRVNLEEYAAKLSSNATLLVAKEGNINIGFSAFYFNPKPKDTYLSLIAVNHNYQKHGVGGGLIQKMIEHCKIQRE